MPEIAERFNALRARPHARSVGAAVLQAPVPRPGLGAFRRSLLRRDRRSRCRPAPARCRCDRPMGGQHRRAPVPDLVRHAASTRCTTRGTHTSDVRELPTWGWVRDCSWMYDFSRHGREGGRRARRAVRSTAGVTPVSSASSGRVRSTPRCAAAEVDRAHTRGTRTVDVAGPGVADEQRVVRSRPSASSVCA